MDIEFHKLIHDGLLELIDELMFKFNIKCVYLKANLSNLKRLNKNYLQDLTKGKAKK